MVMIIKFIFNFCNFSVMICFLTRILTSGILFLTVVYAAFVAKLLTSGILLSDSVSFAFLTRLLTLGIFFLILFRLSDN